MCLAIKDSFSKKEHNNPYNISIHGTLHDCRKVIDIEIELGYKFGLNCEYCGTENFYEENLTWYVLLV